MNSPDVEGDRVVEVPHVRRRHRDVLREAAVAIDPDDSRVGTDVGVARPAEQASAIDDVAFGGDAISLSDIGDEPADLHDISGELVADDEWRLAPASRPRVPLVDVDVGSADAGSSHSNENLILADLRLRQILQLETGSGGFLDQRFHEWELR